MDSTPRRKAASIRPSTFRDPGPLSTYTPNGAYDDKYGAILASDARHAIEHLGKVMRTTTWGYTRGLGRWEAASDVAAMKDVRRILLKRGSQEVDWLDHWRVRLRDGKRWTMRNVSERDRGRCSDLARALGLGAETMAGLAVIAGVFDAPGVPLPINQRLTRDLTDVRLELRERVRTARRRAGLDDDASGPRSRRGFTTWEELTP